jgi:hypothetical protein
LLSKGNPKVPGQESNPGANERQAGALTIELRLTQLTNSNPDYLITGTVAEAKDKLGIMPVLCCPGVINTMQMQDGDVLKQQA